MKTDLVTIQEGKAVTSSLQIAQVFNMEHKNVLQALRNIECSSEFKGLNFQLSFYIREIQDRGQRKYPLYYMTKDGFSFLVMGFTGTKAAEFKENYIAAFNNMERMLKENNSVKYVLDLLESGFKNTNDLLKKRIGETLHENGIKSQPVCDLSFGYVLHREMSVEDCIRNLVNRINSSTIEGWYFYTQFVKHKNMYEYSRGLMQKISSDMYKNFRIFPEE